MNCDYCTCLSCKYYKECEPCKSDWDYEHPCDTSKCDDYEYDENMEKINE